MAPRLLSAISRVVAGAALLLSACGGGPDSDERGDHLRLAEAPPATEATTGSLADAGTGAATDAPTEGDADAAGGGGGAEECPDLQVAALKEVGAPADAERVWSIQNVTFTPDERAALERLATSGHAEVSEPAADALTLPTAASDLTTYDNARGLVAMSDLTRWALDHCEPDTLVWSCFSRGGFQTVLASGVDPWPTPEAVADEDRRTDDERIEVHRDEGEVLFAWIDEDGHATGSVEAVADGEGWVKGISLSCRD